MSIISERLEAAIQVEHNGNNHAAANGQPIFGRKCKAIGKGLMCAGGAASLMAVVAINPVIASAIKGAFAKAGAFITSNVAAFSTSTMGVGVLNVLDGISSIHKGGTQRSELNALNETLKQADRHSPEYSKLKKLYKRTQLRGGLQAAVGAVAVVVGALTFAGVVSNPIGLGVMLGVGAATLVGVQLHKYFHHRKTNAAEKAYTEMYDQSRNAPATAAARQVTLPAAAVGASVPSASSNAGSRAVSDSGGFSIRPNDALNQHIQQQAAPRRDSDSVSIHDVV